MTKSIIIITEDYPAKDHMMFVFVQQLVHAIVDIGIKVTVVAPQSITHKIIHKEKFLPKHYQGVTDKGVIYDIYRPYTLSWGNHNYFKRFTNWFNSRAIVKVISKIDSNILYAHFWSSALYVYKYALKNRYPLFVACGEGDDAIENMINKMSNEKIKSLSTAVTGVISVSSENKRKCIKYGLSLEQKIEVFPNCVNTSIFHKINNINLKKQLNIKDDDFVIAFVGVFTPRKGPDRIAKAITLLNDLQIKVMFIGKSFSGYTYDFDCPGIIYKGPLDHNILPQYMNCADIFVMPTQKEGCCNAIVEALAMGLPVISSNGSFNDDILNENNSIRLDPNNINAIATAIKKLKEDNNLRKKMMEYSLSRHNEYTIEGRAQRIINFIEKKINEE